MYLKKHGTNFSFLSSCTCSICWYCYDFMVYQLASIVNQFTQFTAALFQKLPESKYLRKKRKNYWNGRFSKTATIENHKMAEFQKLP